MAGAYEEGKGGISARRRSGGTAVGSPDAASERVIMSKYLFVPDAPLERRLFGGLTNPNHGREFRGPTLTMGACLPVGDSQLVNLGPVGGGGDVAGVGAYGQLVVFCPVGDFVFSWWFLGLEHLTLDLGRLFGPGEPVGEPLWRPPLQGCVGGASGQLQAPGPRGTASW